MSRCNQAGDTAELRERERDLEEEEEKVGKEKRTGRRSERSTEKNVLIDVSPLLHAANTLATLAH